MGRLLKLLTLILFGTSLSWGQTTVTVTGNLANILGLNVTTNAKVCFSLIDASGNPIQDPRTSGNLLINDSTVCVTPNGSGVFSTSIYPNDLIIPGNTQYSVQEYLNGQYVHGDNFTFNSTTPTYNLNTATPNSTSSLPVVPQPSAGATSQACTFTNAVSTWTCSENMGTTQVMAVFRDANGVQIFPDKAQATDVNTYVGTWLQPQAGSMTVFNVGQWTPSVQFPNYLVANPSAPQTITGQVLHANGGLAVDGDVATTLGGSFSATGPASLSGTVTAIGNLLAKSGKPWYDVMAFGADPTGVSDSTPAFTAAMTAACSATPNGGTIFFPPGKYISTNTSTSPIIVTCDGVELTGPAYTTNSAVSPLPGAQIVCAACNVPIIATSGTRYGLVVRYLGLSGGGATHSASQGINVGATSGDYTIDHVFIDQMGGSAIAGGTSTNGGLIVDIFVENCLLARPASTDTGCVDLQTEDLRAWSNFVTPSVSTAAGNIGAGHTYAWAIRGSNGFIAYNQGDISQHGWLITGTYNTFIGNRGFLEQGNCFNVQGAANTFIGNRCLDASQTATNTFSAWVVTGTQEIFSDNLIDDESSGNGNHTKNGFDDSNSNGSLDYIGNKYSNNKLGNGPTGVLYNMTGVSPFAIQQPHRIETQGDASVTVQCNLNAETQFFNTALTAQRTVTLSTTGAYNGCHFKIVRGDQTTGAFNLLVASSTGNAVLNLPGQEADAEFINSQWRITNYGIGFAAGGATGTGQPVLSTGPALSSPTIGGGLGIQSSGLTCTMSAGTTCTVTVPANSNHCGAWVQGGTPLYASCAISVTTATITANAANSQQWLVIATQ